MAMYASDLWPKELSATKTCFVLKKVPACTLLFAGLVWQSMQYPSAYL